MSIHAIPIHYECNPSTHHLDSQVFHFHAQTSNFPQVYRQACLVLRRASNSKHIATCQNPKAPEIGIQWWTIFPVEKTVTGRDIWKKTRQTLYLVYRFHIKQIHILVVYAYIHKILLTNGKYMLPTSWYQNHTNPLKWKSYNINSNGEVSHPDRIKTRCVLCTLSQLVFHYLRTYGFPNPQCLALWLKWLNAKKQVEKTWKRNIFLYTHTHMNSFYFRSTSHIFFTSLPCHIATPPQPPGSEVVHWTDQSEFERPQDFSFLPMAECYLVGFHPLGKKAVKWYHFP